MSSQGITKSEGQIVSILCCVILLLLCCGCKTKEIVEQTASKDSVAVAVDSSRKEITIFHAIDSVLSHAEKEILADDSSTLTAHIVHTIYAAGTQSLCTLSDSSALPNYWQPIAEQTVIDLERTAGSHSVSKSASTVTDSSAKDSTTIEASASHADSVATHLDTTSVIKSSTSGGFTLARSAGRSLIVGLVFVFIIVLFVLIVRYTQKNKG